MSWDNFHGFLFKKIKMSVNFTKNIIYIGKIPPYFYTRVTIGVKIKENDDYRSLQNKTKAIKKAP